jgi:hypothetical protein
MNRIGQHRRQANESGNGLRDDVCGNARKIRAQTTLVLEAFPKRACGKGRPKFRYYAAGNVNAAVGAKGQSEIAGNCPEHGTKYFDSLAAMCLSVVDTKIGDLSGRIRAGWEPVDLSKRVD